MQHWYFPTVCLHAPCRSLTRRRCPASMSRATRSRLQPLDGPRSSSANQSSLVVDCTVDSLPSPSAVCSPSAVRRSPFGHAPPDHGSSSARPAARKAASDHLSASLAGTTRLRLTPNGVTSDRQPLRRPLAAVCRSPLDRGHPINAHLLGKMRQAQRSLAKRSFGEQS